MMRDNADDKGKNGYVIKSTHLIREQAMPRKEAMFCVYALYNWNLAPPLPRRRDRVGLVK